MAFPMGLATIIEQDVLCQEVHPATTWTQALYLCEWEIPSRLAGSHIRQCSPRGADMKLHVQYNDVPADRCMPEMSVEPTR